MFTAPRRGGLNHNATMLPWEILAENRILHLSGSIMGVCSGRYDQNSPDAISESLIILDSINHDPIKLIIDSPGGIIQDGLNFYNVMQCINSPVYTIGKYCASMAAILFAAGAKGHRYLYPYARIMLHLPQGRMGGDPTEMKRQMAELEKDKDVLVDLLRKHGCTKSKEEILTDIDKEFYLSNDDAVNYGIADYIITPAIHRELFGSLKIPSWQEVLETLEKRR